MRLISLFLTVVCLITPCSSTRAEHEGKLQILLLGDSLTEGSIPKKVVPDGPHLEDVIRLLLAAEGDLPPCHVINEGLSGEYVRRLLDSGRYDRKVSKLPGLDYVLIRYGANDLSKRENFENNFPIDLKELVGRLRSDHPAAQIILVTNFPRTLDDQGDGSSSQRTNVLIRATAEQEQLQLMDLFPRYLEELKRGPNMLNYRRYPLSKIPAKFHPLVKSFVMPGNDPQVVVLDNRLDAHLGDLPGWYGDRHPNLAGYHVIGDETAKFLAPLIRARKSNLANTAQ